MVHMVFSIHTKKPQKAKEKNKNFIKIFHLIKEEINLNIQPALH